MNGGLRTASVELGPAYFAGLRACRARGTATASDGYISGTAIRSGVEL